MKPDTVLSEAGTVLVTAVEHIGWILHDPISSGLVPHLAVPCLDSRAHFHSLFIHLLFGMLMGDLSQQAFAPGCTNITVVVVMMMKFTILFGRNTSML